MRPSPALVAASPVTDVTAPTSVLDASALLAVLHREKGAPVVIRAIADGAAIGVVNLAEVLSRLAEDGKNPQHALTRLRETEGPRRALTIEPFTTADCVAAARLRPTTKPQGLSLADRACLALAKRLGIPALTADRTWTDADTHAEVQLIR
jgi:ribonuclease VapC